MKYVYLSALASLIISYPVYSFLNPSLDTLIDRQNALIDQANNEKLESYRSNLLQCIDTATGKVLQEFDDCTRTPKPTLQERVGNNEAKRTVKLTPTTSEPPSIETVKLNDCMSKYNHKKVCTEYAQGLRTDNIKFEIETEELWKLHDKVCKQQINSPLCKDMVLFARLYNITEERIPGKQFFPVLLGMTNSESSLGLDMAKDNVGGYCHGRNNWGGAKYQIKDDNTRVYKRELNGFSYKYPIDQFGCNLYPFESIEEYWTSKVNGIRYGYKGCIDSKTPLSCISVHYVGSEKVVKPQWVKNASIFIN